LRIEELETRLIELEMKTAFQDDVVHKLREALDEHGEIIARLERELGRAREKLEAVTPSQVLDQKDEVPPPHY